MTWASRERMDRRNAKKRADRLAKKEAAALGVRLVPPILPTDEPCAEDLILGLKTAYARKLAHEEARKLINVKVPIVGPIGILHFGDPHVDDDGTDWAALERDIRLVQTTPGLYAANIGDTTNNWVGRLGHLYGQQSTTAKQAWILAEWFIKQLSGRWLYLIGGNHDAWSGDGDPLRWITGQVGALYEATEARIGLEFPNGRSIVVNARHDFAGGSMWNPTHGPMKAAQLGVRDDIVICGHKHKSGYSPLKDPETGKVMHCLQVASYKRYDRYAREKGFRDQSLSPCVVTVINPDATDPVNLVQVFWDAQAGADYLTFLRRRAA